MQTIRFNQSRQEVRNLLLAAALFSPEPHAEAVCWRAYAYPNNVNIAAARAVLRRCRTYGPPLERALRSLSPMEVANVFI